MKSAGGWGRMRSLYRKDTMMSRRYLTTTVAAVLVMAAATAGAAGERPVRERFLLLDGRLVEKTENAQLVVGTVRKHKANPHLPRLREYQKAYKAGRMLGKNEKFLKEMQKTLDMIENDNAPPKLIPWKEFR